MDLLNRKTYISIFRYLKYRRFHLVDDLLNIIHPRTWYPGDSSPSQEIKKTFYINLESRPDRKKNILHQLKKIGLPSQRVNAFKFNSLTDFYKKFPDYTRRMYGPLLSRVESPQGYLGCYMSHLHAISLCQNEEGVSMIVEDDLVIRSKRFIKWINNYISKIDFDILLIDPQGNYRKSDRVMRNVYKVSETAPFYWGAHCYLVKNSSVNLVLSSLNETHIDSPDDALINAREKVKVYALRTSLCRPKGSFGSDLCLPKVFTK